MFGWKASVNRAEPGTPPSTYLPVIKAFIAALKFKCQSPHTLYLPTMEVERRLKDRAYSVPVICDVACGDWEGNLIRLWSPDISIYLRQN